MRKLLPLLILLCGSVAYGQGRTYTHTIQTSEGTTTIITTCYGALSSNCKSIVTTAEDRSRAYNRQVYLAQLKEMCRDMNAAYGKNLEHFGEPINNTVLECVKNKKLRRQILDTNYKNYLATGKAESIHPLYKPSNNP